MARQGSIVVAALILLAKDLPDNPPAEGPGVQRRRSRGSNRSRTASPTRLTESTTSRIASPGSVDTHHADAISALPSATITPHDGFGGGMPAPRNESVASSTITKPTWSVDSTM